MYVCSHIYKHTSKFSVHVTCGSVPSDGNAIMLCTSGFVDDGMFSHNTVNGPDSKYVLSRSPVGGTGGEVCRLLLHLVISLKNVGKITFAIKGKTLPFTSLAP